MPTYEYRCPNGHDIERFYRKISDATPQVECPECGKMAERIMSVGGGLLFKGSGFYLTDYGKNAHRSSGPMKSEKGEGGAKEGSSAASPASDGGSSAPASSESKSSTSESKSTAESKPAPKAEAKPAASSASTPKKDK